MRLALPIVLFIGLMIAGPVQAAPTFSVADAVLSDPLVLIAYGDIRFTQPGETAASSPKARHALVAKIAAENPAAIFINGDLPYHGISADYDAYRSETQSWREKDLRVYPALGNHEFSACLQSACLDRWWSAFPGLRGRRWYSVAIGSKVLGIALDSDASLMPGSDQRLWLESQLAALDEAVRLVLVVIHHPPVADLQTVKLVDHNVRPNEHALAVYLGAVAAHSTTRFVVSAGHIHNYERLAQDGVIYLVSGGGGATPYDIDRPPEDLYRAAEFPNYHYVRFELHGQHLSGEMLRLEDYGAANPSHWRVKDKFEITLQP
jgi:acid phosphatase type 7